MEHMVPLPGIYDADFIAANQGPRANNVIKGTGKEQIQRVIKDIREFKEKNKVGKNLMASLEKNESEISPSTLFGIACILENVPYINGSPQNTFVPGLIELAIQRNTLIGGDDFKSG
ncbi:hypothetical protein ACS0TY_032705 [Phlomoides rotata]